MTGTPRRPLLRTVPAALAASSLAGVVGADSDVDAGADPGARPAPVADGGRQAVASGAVDVRQFTRRRTTEVTPNGVDEIRIGPDAGRVLELQSVTASAPAVSAANNGRHALSVGVAGGSSTLIEGVASARQPLSFDGTRWREADRGATPDDYLGGVLAVRGLLVDDDVTLSVRYRNDTNATQTDARTVTVWGVERPAGGTDSTDGPADSGDSAT